MLASYKFVSSYERSIKQKMYGIIDCGLSDEDSHLTIEGRSFIQTPQNPYPEGLGEYAFFLK